MDGTDGLRRNGDRWARVTGESAGDVECRRFSVVGFNSDTARVGLGSGDDEPEDVGESEDGGTDNLLRTDCCCELSTMYA